MSKFKSIRSNSFITMVLAVAFIMTMMFFQPGGDGYALGSTCKISGYILSDITYSSSSAGLNSGISVYIEGTSYKTATNNNGYYELNNIPESQNSYTLKVAKTCYLTRTIPNVKLTGNIAVGSQSSPILLWAGDIPISGQQDNAVNMSDIMEVAKTFNAVAGDSRYVNDLDLNMDSSINMADIMIVARNFNKIDANYPPIEIPIPSMTPIPSPTPTIPGATYKVFLLAGQSNMAGIGMNHELTSEYKVPVEGVKIYAAGTVDNAIANTWGTLKIGYGGGAGNFGPELTFGRDMAQRLPNNKVLIIKVAWSGTSLSGDWRPPSAGGTTGQLWTNFITNAKKGLAALGSGIQYEIAGMCWMQGESDACAPNIASDYESNLTAFIGDVRKELNVPNMPFVIAMIDDSNSWPYNAIVRQGELNVANKVPHVGIFDTKDFDTDGMHYKTQGILDMGSLFASTMYSELQK